MHPVMNKTKWDEIRLEMYSLGDLSPKWRTKNLETQYTSNWDGEWFYHFRQGGYKYIEWLEIQVESPAQNEAVLQLLRRAHVPGRAIAGGYVVYGYVPEGTATDYI